jgi:hypothetical protein
VALDTHSDPAAAATLEIVRDTPDDVQDRWVRIYVDDDPVEILRYGETLRRPLTPGPHRIKAHNTLSSHTLHIDARAGQHVRIRCFNSIAKGGVLTMLTIGFAYIRVRLERIEHS